MAEDPRKFIKFSVKNCAASQNAGAADASKRKDFFNGLGKIGDIEALNNIGGGNVSSGLRSLSKISNSIRTGDTNSAIIPNNRGYVYDAVDINQNSAQRAGQFNPGVLNRADAQADAILEQVKKGNYKLEDIPNTFSDIQNLNALVKGIFSDGSSVAGPEICGASPYAIDLIQYAPKYKFLFIVQITMATGYESLAHSGNHLAFVVKNSTRPNVNIDHEEVNMYNFWTRVPKRTVYEPITMRFYDDNKNIGHLFYTSYLRSISPISKLGGMGKAGVLSVEYLQSISMNKNDPTGAVQSAASLSILEGDITSMITEIKLFHIYDYGRSMNVYHFHHPKFLSMNLDELDVAENGGGNEIELQFAYDALHITPDYSIVQDPTRIKELTGENIGAVYPIVPNLKPGGDAPSPEGTDGEDNVPTPTPINVIRDAGTTVTNAVSGALSTATGLVSNAFQQGSNFVGSLFQ